MPCERIGTAIVCGRVPRRHRSDGALGMKPGGVDSEKRCFTYCGDRCDCAARATLEFVAPALPVLATMCETVGLDLGAAKAREMSEAINACLNRPARGRPESKGTPNEH